MTHPDPSRNLSLSRMFRLIDLVFSSPLSAGRWLIFLFTVTDVLPCLPDHKHFRQRA